MPDGIQKSGGQIKDTIPGRADDPYSPAYLRISLHDEQRPVLRCRPDPAKGTGSLRSEDAYAL